jgi:hypothetical protein
MKSSWTLGVAFAAPPQLHGGRPHVFSGGAPGSLANYYQGAPLIVFSLIEGGILVYGGTTPPSVELLVLSL